MRTSAFLRRFCTSTCARFGSVPGLKVTLSSALPLELEEPKYSRFLAPDNSSSMTLVTVSAMVLAEAPGYVAMMEICGGATFGNCDTERLGMASKPARVIKMATTQANLGRSIKKRDMEMDSGKKLRERPIANTRFRMQVREAKPCVRAPASGKQRKKFAHDTFMSQMRLKNLITKTRA